MAINFQSALGLHEQSLLLRERRTEVLAGNLANADTPGYKARDFDFVAALKDVTQGQQQKVSMATTSSKHLGGTSADLMEIPLKYRMPNQPSQDGNTVETHVEQANFAENAVRYQASLTFLSGKFSSLKAALQGEG